MSGDNNRPVIAVDAMGGDHGPSVIVPGVVDAFEPDSPYQVAFYGDETAIKAELDKLSTDGLPISIVHCTQDIAMDESPAVAIRSKQDSPIVRAMAEQKAGKVNAVVSAGSTGAMVAASLIILGRLPGVARPAIGTLIPNVKGEFLLLDVGANTTCTAEYLVSFARMGDVFAREILGLAKPTIGQLNIGEESKKGTDLQVQAFELLSESGLNFVGNVEGNHLMVGSSDVVVTDGFSGNNTLKIIEGIAHFMKALSQHPDLTDEEKAAFGPILRLLKKKYSYEPYGGAMLLGVDGISIISHGRSSALAITNAVRVAWKQISVDLPGKLAAAQK
jgi:phosphate acyltransferase